MLMDISAPLVAALDGIARFDIGDAEDELAAMVSLNFVAEFIPERTEDADALLEIAGRMLPPASEAHEPILAAQVLILCNDTAAALAALSGALIVLRREGHALAERLALNVAAGPMPCIATLRPMLPWERPTIH